MKSAVVDVCVQVGSPLAPVTEYVAPAPAVTYAVPAPVVGYVAPAPAVTYAAPAPVIDYVAPAPSVTFAAPAPVFEYVAPAPVFEFIAPAHAGSFVAPSQQLRPAYSAATVATGVNLDATASQVVGSLPLGEVFAAPVFNQVHQEQLAGGEIPENLVEIPVVPEQVIVHAISRVVDSLPPADEFTVPVYSPVHLANDAPHSQTTPLPGVRPGVLLDPGPPGDEAVAVGYAAASVPLLGAPLLADSSAEAIDGSTLSFLLQRALDDKRMEKEEAKLVAEVNELEEKVAKAEARVMEEIDRLRRLGDRTNLTTLLNRTCTWYLARDAFLKRKDKRKKKKKRRKRVRMRRRSWSRS